MKDTPENQVKLLQNAFDELTLSAGALVSAGFVPLSKGIRWVLDGIREADPATKTLVATLATGGAVFLVWKLGLGHIVTGLRQVVAQAGMAQSAAGGLISSCVCFICRFEALLFGDGVRNV